MAESFAEQLAERLNQAMQAPPAGMPPIAGWRFEVGEGEHLQIGIVDNRLGSVYAPPSVRQQLGGSVYIRWADGLVSQGNVERRTVAAFDDRLATWRRNAYHDPHAPGILNPRPVPPVLLADPAVADLIASGSPLPLEILQRADRAIRAFGVTFLDAGVSAGAGTRTVANSRGLWVRTEQTSCGFWLAADSRYANSYGKRRLIPSDEVERLIVDVGETSRALGKPGTIASGVLPVILPPRVAAEFLGLYIARNLAGSLVANRQSAFSLEDFRARKQVLRGDLRLEVNSLVPWELASERCTSEGVPGGIATLVDAGRLVRPLCDLKYAGITGYDPTPGGQLYLTAGAMPPLADLIRTLDAGLVVYQVLGLHTQDPTSGSYSVTADQALVVRNGAFAGKVKAVLAGNFFEHLQDDATAFGVDPHEITPGIRLRCHVTVQP